LGGLLLRFASAEIIPGTLEIKVLEPMSPIHVRIGIGEAKFMRYSCLGTPADVVITLSTYSERADPLLFLSKSPDTLPTFQKHGPSSFGQWREDSRGDHYVISRSVSPRGGIVGLVNLRDMAQEMLDGILRIRCSYIVAFDALFWNHLKGSSVCPVGGHIEDGSGWTSLLGLTGARNSTSWQLRAKGTGCRNMAQNRIVPPVVVRNVEECGARCKATEGCKGFGFQSKCDFRDLKRGSCNLWSGQCESEYTPCWDDYIMTTQDKDFGLEPSFCSGHGRCSSDGRCVCDAGRTGPACEHRQTDLTVMAEGSYNFQVLAGHYQYFRVRVPPKFIGGILNLEVHSDTPLIVLLRSGDVPTKTKYHLSNFADWLDGRNASRLKFPVLPASRFGELDVTSGGEGRRLEKAPSSVQCPTSTPWVITTPCTSEGYMQCKASCVRCMICLKSSMLAEDRGCSAACRTCESGDCSDLFIGCAADTPCESHEAQMCISGCGSCTACFDSNDQACGLCECCDNCLPLLAKCSSEQQEMHYVYIGIFHHRRYHGDRAETHANVSISLQEDPDYGRHNSMPTSFIGDLYNHFQDMRDLEQLDRELYPKEHQYIFVLDLNSTALARREVEVYKDRLTLIHIQNDAKVYDVELDFFLGPKIEYVLTTTERAPKTLFDFNKLQRDPHMGTSGPIRINAHGEVSIWCAIFGAQHGFVQVSARAYGAPTGGEGSAPQHVVVICLLLLLSGLILVCLCQSRAQKAKGRRRPTVDPAACGDMTCSENGACLGDNPNAAEDRFLTRAGIGDDGI
jgi:hypothetical protein